MVEQSRAEASEDLCHFEVICPDVGSRQSEDQMIALARGYQMSYTSINEPTPSQTQFSRTWDPSLDQQQAVDGILAWWSDPNRKLVTTLSGLAGTGKTTVTGHITRTILVDSSVRIAFATLTGRASKVLQGSLEAAGVEGSAYVGTIHGLLYRPEVDAETGRVVGWVKNQTLDFDLLVIDEASMVDVEMGADLESFGVPILAIGDHGQLPPVSGPSAYMEHLDFKLEKVHRQAAQNPIIKASIGVRKGASIKRLCDFIESTADPRLTWETGDMGLREAIEFAAPPGMMVCYTNAMRSRLNIAMRKYLGYGDPDDEDFMVPRVGETLVCTKNFRDWNTGFKFMNGERATLLSIRPWGRNHFDAVLEMRGEEIECRRMSRHQFGQAKKFSGFSEVPYIEYSGEQGSSDFWKSWGSVGPLFDFGYAMTVHAAQGSQSPHVALVVESAMFRMDEEERARFLYTAVTRASERLMIVTDI